MKRILFGFLGFLLLGAVASGIAPGVRPGHVEAAGTSTVSVPGDRFVPAALTVNVGDTVTWNNSDTDLHTVKTVPGSSPDTINLTVRAGSTASFTFTKAGLYWYYCDQHATYDTTTNQVKANPDADNPAEPQEGFILVLGATTAPSTATVVSPGDSFTPFATTIAAGGTVTFQNTDTDLHTVASVPGFSAAPLKLTLKAGTSTPTTLTTPGLYWYYCDVHATWDPTNGQVAAMATADQPSEPMMGVIAVMPAQTQATPTATATASATAVATASPVVAPAPPQTGNTASHSNTTLSLALVVMGAAFLIVGTGIGTLIVGTRRAGRRS